MSKFGKNITIWLGCAATTALVGMLLWAPTPRPAWGADAPSSIVSPEDKPKQELPRPASPQAAPASLEKKSAPPPLMEKSMEETVPARKLPKAGVTEIRRGPGDSD